MRPLGALATSTSLNISPPNLIWLKRYIYAYALLWIFEGALRRWVFPGLSDVLLVVRDPLVLIIYFHAAKAGFLRINALILVSIAVAVVSLFLTLCFGHGDFLVATYGLRTLILHLPLIYVIGSAFGEEEIQTISRWILISLIPMTFLLVNQFSSPQDALVNIGVGGTGSAGFEGGALDRFRPPGTFSFISGVVAFYSVATAALFAAIDSGKISTLRIVTSSLCIAVACPVSISRTLIFNVILVVGVGCLASISSGKVRLRLVAGCLVAVAAMAVAIAQIPIVDDALQAFSERWYLASTQEGGAQSALLERAFSAVLEPIESALDQPIFGNGLGMGTNVGAKVLVGHVGFLGGEGEWSRLIFEMGPFIGAAFILIRVGIFVQLAHVAVRSWFKRNPVPALFLSVAAAPVLIGQWGVPTTLGFAVLTAGFVLAGAKREPRST